MGITRLNCSGMREKKGDGRKGLAPILNEQEEKGPGVRPIKERGARTRLPIT